MAGVIPTGVDSAIWRDGQRAEPMPGVLGGRIIVYPSWRAPGGSAVSATGEHYVGPIARTIGNGAEDVNVAVRQAAGPVYCDPRLAQQAEWVHLGRAKNGGATEIHLRGLIKCGRDTPVCGVGRAIHPKQRA